MLFKKLIILLFLFNLSCIGDPETALNIYNNRNDNISTYSRHIFDERDGIPEKKLDIENGKWNVISISGLYEPLSKTLSYLIIKDSNGVELMNLRGSDLDNVVRRVTDKKHEEEYGEITYRLDVN